MIPSPLSLLMSFVQGAHRGIRRVDTDFSSELISRANCRYSDSDLCWMEDPLTKVTFPLFEYLSRWLHRQKEVSASVIMQQSLVVHPDS